MKKVVNNWKKMIKNETGFTLVELLAVIVILGVILAIAVPAIGNIIDNSKSSVDEANCDLISNAARLADLDNNPGDSVKDLVDNGYLEKEPKDKDGNTLGDKKVTKNTETGKWTLEHKSCSK